MPQKILVTGGLGFIGSHTVTELIAAGYETVIVDDLSNSEYFILERIERIGGVKPVFYEVDMTDKEKLEEVFAAEKNIGAVIHFAAAKSVAESVKYPLQYFRNNLYSLIHLLECMEATGTRNIIFSSSATVYGDPATLPVTEQTVCKPALSPYGSTKQMGENILEKTTDAGKVRCIALRYFNPVGAHASALLGELPLGAPNNLMPVITQAAVGKIERLMVYGNDYATPDGTCIRDYIHVTDLALAHVKSCERLLANRQDQPFEIFNVGTGKGYSVLEIIRAFEKYNQVPVPYVVAGRRPGDAEQVYADVSLAAQKLQWKAERGLEEMVTSAWQWQLQLRQLFI